MKKLFTILGAALMFGSLTVNAETALVGVYSYDAELDNYLEYQPFESEIVKNEDGSYTMQEFFNSGYPASFIIEESESPYKPIKMCKNIFLPEGEGWMPYIMKSESFELDSTGWPANEDDYSVFYVYNEDGSYETIWYPYVDDLGSEYSSYAMALDPSWGYGYDNVAMIYVQGTLSNGDFSNWYYLEVYFNEPEVAGPSDEEEGQPITVWTSYWDEEESESMEMKDYNTVLIKNEDGSYTIKDFFNSGIPASFTFEENSSSFMKPLHMCGNIWNDPDRPGLPFLMTSSDYTIGSEGYPVNIFDYMTSYAYYLDGTVTTVNMTFVDETSNYASYVMMLDPDCTAFITLSGADANGNELPEFHMQFEFNLSYWDNTGVKNVEDNSNAPVEYYNINGMRVNDPSNGIFIRKQGSEVKKVIIK